MYGPYHSVWFHLETHLGVIVTAADRNALRNDLWVRLYAMGVWQVYREVHGSLMEHRMVA